MCKLRRSLRLSYWRIAKVITLLLLVPLILQLNTQKTSEAPEATLKGEAENRVRGAQVLSGRLMSHFDRSLYVNGNSIRAGTTILPGQQVEVPSGTTASIDLKPMGRLELAPGTKLKLAFDRERIDVLLLSGCVVLLTNKLIRGSVKTLAGKEERSDPLKGPSLEVCTGGVSAAGPSLLGTLNSSALDSNANSIIEQVAAAGAIIVAAGSDFRGNIRPCWRGRTWGFTRPANYNNGCF